MVELSMTISRDNKLKNTINNNVISSEISINPGIFVSAFQRSLGSKYRIALPAEFRSVLSGANAFVAFKAYGYQAIECYSLERMQQLSQKMDILEPFSSERDEFSLSVFSESITVTFDIEDGRMTLPQSLADFAQIQPGQDIIFAGKGSTFQIWSIENYVKHQEQSRAALIKRRLVTGVNSQMNTVTKTHIKHSAIH